MSDAYQRSRLLLGEAANEKLKNSTVAVFGVGGVGSFAAEALARTGVGRLVLVDKDTVEISNINRQLVANLDTLGQVKVEILKDKIARLNPECEVIGIYDFYDSHMNDRIRKLQPDFILDCIDSIGAKKDLLAFALEEEIPILSSMGMARKKDPSRLAVMELEETTYDPIAKILRSWKRKNKIQQNIYVVSSDEEPMDMKEKGALPSAVFVPGSAGLLMASKAVESIVESEGKPVIRLNKKNRKAVAKKTRSS